METNSNRKNFNQTFLTTLYINIKELSISISFFSCLSYIFEFSGYFSVIDIICNYNRNWLNYTSMIYFLSSVFYSEYLINSIDLNHNCTIMPNESYNKDQISIVINKLFKANIPSLDCSSHRVAYTSIACLLIIIIIGMLLIQKRNIILAPIQKICLTILYLLFKSFHIPLMVFYNHQLFVQLALTHSNISYSFAFDILFAFFFNSFAFLFYKYLIYAYKDNAVYFLINSNRFTSEMILNLISHIILILRLDTTNWVILYVLWVLLFAYYFFVITNDFIYMLHKSNKDKFHMLLFTALIAIFITRLITMALINYVSNHIVLQAFEILIIFLLIIVIYNKITSLERVITFSMLDTYFYNNDYLFLYGIHQLLGSLSILFRMKIEENKTIDKQKDILIDKLRKDVKDFFCKFKLDSEVFNISDNTSSISYLNNNKSPTNTYTQENKNTLLNSLLKLLNNYDIKTSGKKNDFSVKAAKLLKYKLILLYFIIDDTIFRAEFFLKQFICSFEYKKISLLYRAIFDALEHKFLSMEKKPDEIGSFYLLFFLKLNNAYYSIIKSFSSILKSFTKSLKELMNSIDINSKDIGLLFKQVGLLNKQSAQSIKIKEQPEHEKYNFIEELMFNNEFNKSVEYFDVSLIDSVIEKNNYFVILFENNNFIIKKAPLLYKELSGYKTTNLKNKMYINIFPIQIRDQMLSNIFENILKKREFSIQTVIESKDHYLIGINIDYALMPFISGQLFFTATIECESKIEQSNYALMYPNGKCIKIGYFFNFYFGIENQTFQFNLFKIFNIKNFDPSKQKTLNTFLNSKDLISNLTTYYLKENMNNQSKNLDLIIEKIKKTFMNKKQLSLELLVKNHIKMNKEEYYLLEFNFSEIKEAVINQKKETQLSLMHSAVYKQQLSTQTYSTSSVLSYKMIKEKNMKAMYEQKGTISLKKRVLDRTTFIYNIILIAISIAISIFIQLYSVTFYDIFLQLTSAREIAYQFYYGNFHLSNMIIFNDSQKLHHQLNDYYVKNVSNYTIRLFDYYQKDLNKMSQDFFLKYIYLTGNFTENNSKSYFASFLNQNVSLIQNDGKFKNETFLTVFNIPKNYFHILAQNEAYYLEIPLVSIENIPSVLVDLNENQQYALIIIYNTILAIRDIEKVVATSKEIFSIELKQYTIIIYIIFVLFLLCNMFSLCLLFLSVKISNNQILSIVNQLLTIKKKEKEFYQLKIKVIKGIILNEMAPSKSVSRLKEKIHLIGNRQKSPGKILNNQEFISNNSNNSNINNISDENNSLINHAININRKFCAQVYKTSIKTILLLASIYIIISIIAFPVIHMYVNLIESHQIEVESSEDIIGLILVYYFGIKYSILLNYTDIITSLSLFDDFAEDVYSNYTLINTKLFFNSSSHYIDYVNIINAEDACSSILYDDEFYDSLVSVCKTEPILRSNLDSMTGTFMEQLRFVYNDFITGDRLRESIISSFHSILFQRNSLTNMMYFLRFYTELRVRHLLPNFQSAIASLSAFLVIMFVLLVFINILNYFLSTIFVIDNLSRSLNNYCLLNKFFSNAIFNKEN